MKSGRQKLQDEVGLYLEVVRRRKEGSKDEIAGSLGYSTANFITRVETGKAAIPIARIKEFAQAYGLPLAPFGRLVLAAMHPDVYASLLTLLKHDELLAKTAAGCHGVKDETRFKRTQVLDTELRQTALAEMRDFLADNPLIVDKIRFRRRGRSAVVEGSDES